MQLIIISLVVALTNLKITYCVEVNVTRSSIQIDSHDTTPTNSETLNPLLKSFWIYRPDERISAADNKDIDGYKKQLREPRVLTRLAKSFSYHYDPYFHKNYFEPFERRSKPVTLLAFRRNNMIPRNFVQIAELQHNLDETAELQSPFNSIGQPS